MTADIIVLASLVKQLEEKSFPRKDLMFLTDPGAISSPEIFLHVNKIVEKGNALLVNKDGEINHEAIKVLKQNDIDCRMGYCDYRQTPTCTLGTRKGNIALV